MVVLPYQIRPCTWWSTGLWVFWGGLLLAVVGPVFPWGLLAFCVCFGIGDECFQDWLDHARTPDVWDSAADAAGAFIGLLLSMVFWKR